MTEKPKKIPLTLEKIKELETSRDFAKNSQKHTAERDEKYMDVAHKYALKENAIYDKNKDIPKVLTFPWSSKDSPTDEELKEFFTPEIISSRIFFCPKINRDMTDELSIHGYEEGFIFIEGIETDEVKSINDEEWINGESLEYLGAPVPILPHYDDFPKKKFSHIIITPRKNPGIYNFLRNKLGKIKLLEESK